MYDHQVPLEMAPTCHVHVGAVPDLASHPIGPMLRHGFNVSVNTDNRLMSGVMPSTELLAVATTFNLELAEIEQLVVNGVMAGFAPLETRKQVVEQQVHPAFATTQRPPDASGAQRSPRQPLRGDRAGKRPNMHQSVCGNVHDFCDSDSRTGADDDQSAGNYY